MSDWTPGPWVAKEYNDGDSRPQWLIQAPRPGTPARPWVGTIDKRADARLIAAAPEMAELLIAISEYGTPFTSAIELGVHEEVDGLEWMEKVQALLKRIARDERDLDRPMEKQFPDGDSESFR